MSAIVAPRIGSHASSDDDPRSDNYGEQGYRDDDQHAQAGRRQDCDSRSWLDREMSGVAYNYEIDLQRLHSAAVKKGIRFGLMLPQFRPSAA
jgi:hypothetical protein